MNPRNLLICLFVSLVSTVCAQDETVQLWPGGIPYNNALEEEVFENPSIGRIIQKVHQPEIAVFHPPDDIANGTGVLICPGGGYFLLAWDLEGVKIAKYLNSIGISAFVLKYRLPHWESEQARSRVALQDAQRAMKVIRMNAGKWKLDPGKIGVMGFSAGGHLASSLSTKWDRGLTDSMAEVEHYSCRPDFSILVYPVISMMPDITHTGSRDNLISPEASPKMVHYYSNETQVTGETPETILIHASDDRGVLPDNSLNYYKALIDKGVRAAIHIFENGGHGFGLGTSDMSVGQWPEMVRKWLLHGRWLNKRYKILLIDGQSDVESWTQTSEYLKALLSDSGRFLVDINRSPPAGDRMDGFDPSFDQYDAVILNYNGESWSSKTKNALERYVGEGGGLVITHSASKAFANWSEFDAMRGLSNHSGQTGRPLIHVSEKGERMTEENTVVVHTATTPHDLSVRILQKSHPIVKGLPAMWIQSNDVLLGGFSGPAKNLGILASSFSDPNHNGTGRNEPVLMTVIYGHGRVFHSTLGREPEALQSPGYQTTFIRGVEWAITGEVTDYKLYGKTATTAASDQSDVK